MKTHTKHIDTLYRFGTPGNLGCCRLQIFRPGPDRPNLVVMTEMPGPGPCLTNAVEAVASDVARVHGLDADSVLFVVHLVAMTEGPDEVWAVAFDRDDSGRLYRPAWRAITPAAVGHLAGAPLSD